MRKKSIKSLFLIWKLRKDAVLESESGVAVVQLWAKYYVECREFYSTVDQQI